LCYYCHADKKNLQEMKYVHPVVTQGCTECHDPHGGPSVAMLPDEGSALCVDCHTAVGAQVTDPSTTHAAITDGGCAACHDPHGTGNYKMLHLSEKRFCVSCHDQIGRNVAYGHGPVEAGECWVCHDPHASPYRPLLNSYYPEEFYTGFELGNYDLCFACHTTEAFIYDRTAELTGFRNGDANLHYLHVNRPDKSRVCKSCHGVHGADQPKLIQSRIPGFGAWKIPIRFTQHDTGATCVVGCHKPKTYDRLKPVRYE
jgi:predicted CXXCH cytochrome family protein